MPLEFLTWNSPPLDFSRIRVKVILINITIIITIIITMIVITIIILIKVIIKLIKNAKSNYFLLLGLSRKRMVLLKKKNVLYL